MNLHQIKRLVRRLVDISQYKKPTKGLTSSVPYAAARAVSRAGRGRTTRREPSLDQTVSMPSGRYQLIQEIYERFRG